MNSKPQLSSQHLFQIKDRMQNDVPEEYLSRNKDGFIIISNNFEVSSFVTEISPNPPHKLKFEGIIFHGQVKFVDPYPGDSFIFNNCTFNGDTEFRWVNEFIFFQGKNNFAGKSSVNFSQTKQKEIIFENIELTGELIVIDGTNHDLTIKSINNTTKENKGTLIVCAQLGKLKIEDIFTKTIDFGNFEGRKKHKSIFNDEVNIKSIGSNSLRINDIEIKNVFRIISSKINEFRLANLLTSSNRFEIKDGCKFIDFRFSIANLKTIIFENSDFVNLTLTDSNMKEQRFKIASCEIKKVLKFEEVDNQGAIVLHQIAIPENSFFSIINSDLGKTSFFLCKFKKIKLEFENSKITEVFLVDSEFPKQKQIYLKDKKNPIQAKLLFGQLHTASKKQGDTVNEITYQSREMAAHFRLITWKQHFFTKLNLALNLLSNNFGRSWEVGIVFTISCGLIFFYGIVTNSTEFSFGDQVYFKARFILPLLKFMNPLRFFDTESLFQVSGQKDTLHLTFGSYLFDFFGRIFITYGYYQTIQAFRRFGRK